jgi:hypothetical protein
LILSRQQKYGNKKRIQEDRMPKKVFLGNVENEDKEELFTYVNTVYALTDLKNTLEDPNAQIAHMLDGISHEEIDKELNEAIRKRAQKLDDIHNKYQFAKTIKKEELVVMEDGKAYRYKKNPFKEVKA